MYQKVSISHGWGVIKKKLSTVTLLVLSMNTRKNDRSSLSGTVRNYKVLNQYSVKKFTSYISRMTVVLSWFKSGSNLFHVNFNSFLHLASFEVKWAALWSLPVSSFNKNWLKFVGFELEHSLWCLANIFTEC